MIPFLKSYTGASASVYAALASARTQFRGTLQATGGTITIRKTGQTTDSVTLLTTDVPVRLDGVDLSQIEFLGNTFVLKAVGVLQNGG